QRQGDAVQLAANLGDSRRVSVAETEANQARGGALDEQPHGFGAGQGSGSGGGIGLRKRERADGIKNFRRNGQTFAAGGENNQLRASAEQRLGQLGTGLNKVFAVIQ